MGKFIKNNFKILIALIIGFIITVTGVYAATILYNSNQVGVASTSGLSSINTMHMVFIRDGVFIQIQVVIIFQNFQQHQQHHHLERMHMSQNMKMEGMEYV